MNDGGDYMREAALAIIALLELNRTGQPASVELRQVAENAAQGLLKMSRHLSATRSEAEADGISTH